MRLAALAFYAQCALLHVSVVAMVSTYLPNNTCAWDGMQEPDLTQWTPQPYTFSDRAKPQGPGAIDQDILEMTQKLSLEEKAAQMTQIEVGQLIDCNGELNQTAVDYWVGQLKVGSILETPANHGGRYQWYSPQKFSQLTDAVQRAAQKANAPPVLWGLDSVRGANYIKGGTIFPAGITTAATFSTQYAYGAGRVAAKDTRAAGVHWAFAPVLDLTVNKLWTRTFESFGEDPYLSAQMAKESVAGFQGDYRTDRQRVAACLKHFIGYGYPFDGSDRANRHIATHELLEYYVPPFQAAIDAGVSTAMESYGVVNGEAVMLSHYYLRQLLRKQLGFRGMLVTDWGEIISQATMYFTARDASQATEVALKETSVDMSMVADDDSFTKTVVGLVGNGTLAEARLDESVARILQLKKDLGLFTSPFADPELAATVGSPQDVELARNTARESITLLKNKDSMLPLSKSEKVLFLGPTLNSTRYMGGGWNVHWQGPSEQEGDAVYQGFGDTVLEGIRNITGSEPQYFEAVDINGTSISDIDKVVAAAKKVDKIVVGLGERTYTENGDNIGALALAPKQLELVDIVAKKSGKPVAVVLVQGRPRLLGDVAETAHAIVNAYLPGVYGGLPIAEILYGKVSPSGRLPITYPATEAQASTTIWQPSYVAYNPQWAFGFGLGYSRLSYSNVTVSHDTWRLGRPLTVSVSVTNHGPYAQKEVVQLYTQQKYRLGYAPDLYRLRKFQKIDLQVNETKTVEFSMAAEVMAFWDRNLRRRIEPAPVVLAVNPFTQKDVFAQVQLEADPRYVLDEAEH